MLTSNDSNTVDVFDLLTRELCETLTMSTHRADPCGVATESEVVIAGGCYTRGCRATPLDTVEAYSPTSGRYVSISGRFRLVV